MSRSKIISTMKLLAVSEWKWYQWNRCLLVNDKDLTLHGMLHEVGLNHIIELCQRGNC
jgi:hypothetical protein